MSLRIVILVSLIFPSTRFEILLKTWFVLRSTANERGKVLSRCQNRVVRAWAFIGFSAERYF